MLSEEDINFWKWLSGLALPILGFVGLNSWKASAKMTSFEARVKSLEDFKESQAEQCSLMQERLAEHLQLVLEASFKDMLNGYVAAQTKELSEISKNIALLAQANTVTQAQFAELLLEHKKYVRPIFNSDDTFRRRRTDMQRED